MCSIRCTQADLMLALCFSSQSPDRPKYLCFSCLGFPPSEDLRNTVRGRLISSYRHESVFMSARDLATLTVEPLPGLRDTPLTWPSGLRLLFAASWGLGPLQPAGSLAA